MPFHFTEAQEKFRLEVREFTERELAPGALERAKLERIPAEIIKKVADAGYIGLNISEKYGGSGGDWITWGIALEEMCRRDIGVANLLILAQCWYGPLSRYGTEELRQEWVPDIVKGKMIGCMGITEPHAGSDVAILQATAVKDGDSYIINGEKTTTAHGMQANAMLMWAKTDPEAGARGLSCFLVPMDSPGINRWHLPSMGCKQFGRSRGTFKNVRIPARNLVGQEGDGFRMFATVYSAIRIGSAIMPLGMARMSIDEAIDFSKQRMAFGFPIAHFEAVSFKIVEAITNIEAARLLCYHALELHEDGQPHLTESAMCKYHAPEVALKAMHDALIIQGWYGFGEDRPVEQRVSDCIGFEILDGTADVMKTIIARDVIGKEASFR